MWWPKSPLGVYFHGKRQGVARAYDSEDKSSRIMELPGLSHVGGLPE